MEPWVCILIGSLFCWRVRYQLGLIYKKCDCVWILDWDEWSQTWDTKTRIYMGRVSGDDGTPKKSLEHTKNQRHDQMDMAWLDNQQCWFHWGQAKWTPGQSSSDWDQGNNAPWGKWLISPTISGLKHCRPFNCSLYWPCDWFCRECRHTGHEKHQAGLGAGMVYPLLAFGTPLSVLVLKC